MANWFPMALKEGARTWLLNLAQGTISSWDQMRTRFIANFQGTRDRPPTVSDMRRIKQQPGETLQKYIVTPQDRRFRCLPWILGFVMCFVLLVAFLFASLPCIM